MSQRRGTTGSIKGTNLPKEHIRTTGGLPWCGAKQRRWGFVFVKENPTCCRCALLERLQFDIQKKLQNAGDLSQ